VKRYVEYPSHRPGSDENILDKIRIVTQGVIDILKSRQV
jgi:hypothetical protein